MGMGYNPCFDYVVGEDVVQKVCEQEWSNLMNVLDKYDVSLVQLAQSVQFQQNLCGEANIEEEDDEEITSFYNELLKKFHDETNIQISLSYHDSANEGSRYDDISGAFFVSDWSDIVEYTPKMKQAKEKGIDIQMKAWVVYG